MLSVIFRLFRWKRVTSWHHLWGQMTQYLSKHFKFFFFPTDFDHIGRRLNIREMSFINVLNGSIQTEGMNFKQAVSLNLSTFSHTFSASVLGCS